MNAKTLGIRGLSLNGFQLGRSICPLGVHGLDAKLGGGIPAGSTVLILSEPCNAPYILCEQFASAGLVGGERVHYYSMERPYQEVEHRIAHLCGDAAMGLLGILDLYSVKMRGLTDQQLSMLGIENHAPDVTKALGPFLLGQRSSGPHRIVFESLTEVVRHYGFKAAAEMLSVLTGIVKATGGTALLMIDRGIFGPNVETEFKHLADGVIELGQERTNFDNHPYLTITKMRGVPDAGHLHWYRETDRGIVLESVNRVN